MVFYDKDIKKEMKKGILPREVVRLFSDAFQALDQTKNLNLFDIKKLLSSSTREYYRLRKGKYRAIFTIEDQDFYVHAISKRSEVYKKWPL
jgi:mRNA interferase RelE/StbE